MTYGEMENFTYAELENFAYFELSMNKLELLQKFGSNTEIPDSIKQKLSELCYEVLHSYDSEKFKDLNIPTIESKFTIGDLIHFYEKVQTVAELTKCFLPYASNLLSLALDTYNIFSS